MNNELVTKADLESTANGLRAEMKADLESTANGLRAEMKTDLENGLASLRDELIEVIRDSEARLLRAFYSFAESNQKRLSALELTDAAIINRVATLESRLMEVEKRLNIPPAA